MELRVSYRKNPFYRFSFSCAATASVYDSYYLLFSSRFRAHGSFSCYSRIIYTDNSHGLSIFSYVCVCISLYAYVRAARAYAVTSAKLVPPFYLFPCVRPALSCWSPQRRSTFAVADHVDARTQLLTSSLGSAAGIAMSGQAVTAVSVAGRREERERGP